MDIAAIVQLSWSDRSPACPGGGPEFMGPGWRKMINRRDFVSLLSSGVAAPGVMSALATAPNKSAAPAPLPQPKGRQRRPNVIVMICDDLGYGDLGCYGSQMPTPNLDKLAAEGMRFTRFNAGHPICSASRAALLTGRYGLRSGTSGAFGPNAKSGTSVDETLISNLCHDHGYKTKAIGKWHLGDRPEYMPTSRGFDSFYGVPYSDDMKPLPLIRDRTILEPEADRDLLTPRYTEEAVKYIDEAGDEPYFMYLGFSYPHHPARASARFLGKTGFGDFGDSVAEIDWSAGEIMRAVDRKGHAADTLICFTSDHGPWYQGSPGALRGRKASTFEGGFRVPLIARWQGRIAPGKVADQWCSNLDILPTLAAICGLGLPEKPLDGIDISEILLGHGKVPERKPVLYFSPMSSNGLDLHCIRRENWKLRVAQGTLGEIYINDRTTQSKRSAWLAKPELYDIARDPEESYDVAKAHPEIVADLMASLEAQIPSFPPQVVATYTRLKQDIGGPSTPAGGSPRPVNAELPAWDWETPE